MIRLVAIAYAVCSYLRDWWEWAWLPERRAWTLAAVGAVVLAWAI